MILTNETKTEVLREYDLLWKANLSANIEVFASYLVDDFSMIGSANGEVFFNKEDTIAFYSATAHQLAGKAQLRNRNISLQCMDENNVVIREQCDLYVLIEPEWTFYGHARISCIMKKVEGHWKAFHQHVSFPDHRTEEGQQIAVEKVEKENLALREAVQRRTVELEDKNRELEIEAALERVRSRTMAMRQSNDLSATAALLFQQLRSLGIDCYSSGFTLWDNEDLISWMCNADGSMNPPFRMPVEENEWHRQQYHSWKNGEALISKDLAGEELKSYFNYLRSFPLLDEAFKTSIAAGYPMPERQIHYVANFSQGNLLFITLEPVPEAQNVFIRLARVFEQTYTRFLDLQKAEAQTREAQIEAALERVRSSSLAMYKSDDINDVVKVLILNLELLGIQHIDSLNINIFHEGSKDFDLWIATPGRDYTRNFHLPYFDHPIANDFFKAVEAGKVLHKKTYGFEEKNEYFRFTFENSDNKYLPQERKDLILKSPAYSVSAAIAQHSSLFVHNYSGKTFSKEADDIFIRFANVFDQAYKRFLDLHKAELLVREAVKQASLDRIRGQVAGMRSTGDLQRITQLIWEELIKLNIAFRRCGIFIMDEWQAVVLAYLSTPTNQSLGVLHLPFVSDDLTQKIVTGWRNKEVVRHYWTAPDFINWMQVLVDRGQIKSIDSFLDGVTAPGPLYLHFVPFEQGMLYVGSSNPFADDELNSVQSMADAFSVAYGRYEDFSKLEKAKLSVEKTLSELKTTQAQLIQSEKMASLGELTAGIAHEIQNPLNFVNNFSEVNRELLQELEVEIEKGNAEEIKTILKDLADNEEKINFHGKRADAIVKGMLQHSRTNKGEKEPTNINALCDEYLRLTYHGLRAKDKTFNASLRTRYDDHIGMVSIVPQDVGRVILNLLTNAFYACSEKSRNYLKNAAIDSKSTYQPTVTVGTKKLGDKIEIMISDNGNGIPSKIVDKIFHPFFTTKPSGQGTGLGLSLSYDIVKAHGGDLKVETTEGEGTEFIIQIPLS